MFVCVLFKKLEITHKFLGRYLGKLPFIWKNVCDLEAFLLIDLEAAFSGFSLN